MRKSIDVAYCKAHRQDIKQAIIACYNRRSVTEPVDWYVTQGSLLLSIAREEGLDLDQVAHMTAHLSPRMSWERNIELLRNCIALCNDCTTYEEALSRWREVGQTRAQTTKAIRVYWWVDGAKHGPKTGPFAANLLGCTDSVTIDRHAIAISLGHPDEQRGEYRITPKAVDLLADIWRETADELHTTPRKLQAVTWEVRQGAM